MNFQSKLRSLLAGSPYSQEAVADSIGVSQPQISRWAKGTAKPDLIEALALARFFGIDPVYLADDQMEKPPEPAELAEDERLVLEFYRSLKEDPSEKMTAREAMRRLRLRPEADVPRIEGTEPPRHGPNLRGDGGRSTRRSS